MVLTKKAQIFFYTLMLGVVVLILALAFADPLREFIDTARSPSTDNSVGLDCANSSISDFDKANCAMLDISMPYFFFGLLALVGIIIGAKVMIE